MTTLSTEEKKKRVKALYTLDEMCEILGYFDGSNPDLDYPTLELHQQYSPNTTFEEMIVEKAIENGNFEEAIENNVRFSL